MSKINSLIKKVNVFEKLAVFADQSAFLKKISQRADAGAALDSLGKITAGARAVLELLKNEYVNTKSSYIQSKISNLELFLNSGLSTQSAQALYNYLLKTEQEMGPDPAYTKLVGQMDSYVAQMQKELKLISTVDEETSKDLSEQQISVPQAPATQKSKYPAISSTVQFQLNGLGSPIKLVEDGILGPDTQKALQWFKDTFKFPFSGQALYNEIASEFKTKRLNETGPNLDDAAKQHEEAARNFRLT